MDRRASLFVLRLTSMSAVNKSVKIRFTCSLVELVTRESAANETRACSPLDVFCLKFNRFVSVMLFVTKRSTFNLLVTSLGTSHCRRRGGWGCPLPAEAYLRDFPSHAATWTCRLRGIHRRACRKCRHEHPCRKVQWVASQRAFHWLWPDSWWILRRLAILWALWMHFRRSVALNLPRPSLGASLT